MFQNRQKVVVVTGGDPSRVIKVQAGAGDPSRVPVVTTDGVLGRDQQVQVVSGGDSTRFPILNGVNPILALSPAAYYPYAEGITVTGAGVSMWADASGNGRHLLQGTDTKRPAYSGGIITFDGVDNYLKTNAFTLNQPETVYLVVNQVSWTNSDMVWDGNSTYWNGLQADTSTPNLSLKSGAALVAKNGNLAVGAYGVLAAVYNGASSLIQVNNTTATTGDTGTQAAGGFTLGSRAVGDLNANIAVKECAIFAAAHDDATRSQIISYLMAKHGIA